MSKFQVGEYVKIPGGWIKQIKRIRRPIQTLENCYEFEINHSIFSDEPRRYPEDWLEKLSDEDKLKLL